MEDDISLTSQTTPAAVRREQWRETQQISVGSVDDTTYDAESRDRELGSRRPPDPFFKFDSLEHEQDSGRQQGHLAEAEEYEVLPHRQSRSPQSSFSSQISGDSAHFCMSPQISVDSPRISFSPLQIRDSVEEEQTGSAPPHRSQSLVVPEHVYQQPTSPRPTRGRPGAGHRSPLMRWTSPVNSLHPSTSFSQHSPHSTRARSVSPISPAARSTPRSPVPGHFFGHYEQYFRSRFIEDEESYRRCMSDTDLSTEWQAHRQQQSHEGPDCSYEAAKYDNVFYPASSRYPPKTSSVESDQSSIQDQDLPLDLSMRSSLSSTSNSESSTTRFLFPARKAPKLSSGSLHSLSSDKEVKPEVLATKPEIGNKKYSLEMGPVAEGGSSDQGFICPLCNQVFSVHDRLAKHMASRHKSRSTDLSSKSYPCDVCKRSFARSDMLTRHMRLHTGIKPYTCRVCGQVFSRSDHLSTHQRTHTGEKPYRCPTCPYSACRRDMITRHLRTHTRYEHQESTSIDESKPTPSLRRSISTESESISTNLSEGRITRDFARYSWDTGDPSIPRDISDNKLSENSDRMSVGSENLLSVNSDRRISDFSDSRYSDLDQRAAFDRSSSSSQQSFDRSPHSNQSFDRSPHSNRSFDRSPLSGPPGGSFDLQNSRINRDFNFRLEEQSSKESCGQMSRDLSEDNFSGSTG